MALRIDGTAQKPMPNSISPAEYEQKLEAFTPDQRELRQLLVVKLRALASSVDKEIWDGGIAAHEIRRAVDRLRDIAGAME